MRADLLSPELGVDSGHNYEIVTCNSALALSLLQNTFRKHFASIGITIVSHCRAESC